MSSVRRFRLHFLGCKVNQWETQWLREGLRALGLDEAEEGEPGDLVVLNSCSVTGQGGARSRHALRALRRENPAARLVVTGCYAESDPEVCAAIAGVDRVFGNGEKGAIVPWVARELLGMDGELPELPRGISAFAGRTRAFVKIQDGCRDRCRFCIIPTLRGEVRSRGEDEIVAELERLAAAGHREVVFTGIHLGYYGFDRREPGALVSLLRRAREVRGLARAKLSSIEVHEIDDALVELFAGDPEFFVPHFHLPLQAGCDRTLARMSRRYTTRRFRAAVDLLRSRLEEPALTTDLIVGFPGETAEDFEASRAFCEEIDLAKIHVFPFSPREGTPAASDPDRVPPAEMARRKRVMAELDDAGAARFRRRFLGRSVSVLVERGRELRSGRRVGLTDRFCRIEFPGPAGIGGELRTVRVTGVVGDRLLGVLEGGAADPVELDQASTTGL
ncbi:MAG: tRNA (N(6)-L-threonylcarbamoyladenosine(37)-C(2))-methylthiotransferase MtaB [Planctomycetota bacterium]